MAVGTLTQADRAAIARAALERAEQRTGARSVRTHTRPAVAPAPAPLTVVPEPAPEPEGPARPVRSAPAPGDQPVAGPQGEPATALLVAERPPLPVPPPLAPLLPEGLRRGAATVVTGSTSLLLALVAAACAGGGWSAVVGQPSVGLLAAAQAGVTLDRFALVPQPGPQTAHVLAALVDGLDVVVVGPQAALPEADRRRITARVRDRGAVLLSTVPWPGAQVVLTVEHSRWTGVGTGDGRLRAQQVRVARSGRSGAGVPAGLDLTLPFGAQHTQPPAPLEDETRSPLRLVG